MAVDDELAPLITACPNCGTRFRVTEDQLQVAKGQVRCGSCLHVFDGTAQLIQDGEALGASDAEDVDALLDEIDGQLEEETPPEVLELDEEPSQEAIQETIQEPELELIEAVDTPEADGVSVLDAEPDWNTNEEESPDPESEARLKALEDELMADLKGVLSTTEATPVDVDDRASEEEEVVPEAIGALLEEKTEAENTEEQQEEQAEASEEGQLAADLADESTEIKPDSEEQVSSGHVEIELKPVDADLPRVQEIPAELLQDDEVPKRGWSTWVVMLLAVIALPAQVLWFQYDDWVKDDTMRPVYAFICNVAGCELPQRRNVGLIVAKQSVLRDHPDQDGALIFDALLVNHATYAQAFPIVELSLINMDRFVVASGRFKPEEYLAGEALNAKMMDPRTPIHISLELKKPEQETPNFKIRFIPTG